MQLCIPGLVFPDSSA